MPQVDRGLLRRLILGTSVFYSGAGVPEVLNAADPSPPPLQLKADPRQPPAPAKGDVYGTISTLPWTAIEKSPEKITLKFDFIQDRFPRTVQICPLEGAKVREIPRNLLLLEHAFFRVFEYAEKNKNTPQGYIVCLKKGDTLEVVAHRRYDRLDAAEYEKLAQTFKGLPSSKADLALIKSSPEINYAYVVRKELQPTQTVAAAMRLESLGWYAQSASSAGATPLAKFMTVGPNGVTQGQFDLIATWCSRDVDGARPEFIRQFLRDEGLKDDSINRCVATATALHALKDSLVTASAKFAPVYGVTRPEVLTTKDGAAVRLTVHQAKTKTVSTLEVALSVDGRGELRVARALARGPYVWGYREMFKPEPGKAELAATPDSMTSILRHAVTQPPTPEAVQLMKLTETHFGVPQTEMSELLSRGLTRDYLRGRDASLGDTSNAQFYLEAFRNVKGAEVLALQLGLIEKNAKGAITKTFFTPMSSTKFDAILSLLYMAEDAGSSRVVDTILREKPNLAFSFESQRTKFDLKRDLSTVLIIARELRDRISLCEGRPEMQKLLDTMVVRSIANLRARQEAAFKEVELVPNAPGRMLKTFDVLVIHENSLKINAISAGPACVKFLNAQKGQTPGELKMLNSMDFSNREDLGKACKKFVADAAARGHALVVVVELHGGPGSINLPTKAPIQELDYTIDKLRKEMGIENAYCFVDSCFAGAQVDRLRDKDPKRARPELGRLYTGAGIIVNLVESENTLPAKLAAAFSKVTKEGKNGEFFAADLNRNGEVSMAELMYFMDTGTRFGDGRSTDSQGRQLSQKSEGSLGDPNASDA